MGKKSKISANLGRSLIKDRFGAHKGRKLVGDKSMLHTTEIQDGYDWGRLNLQSVTEESSFQEFLSTAELTGAEFQAEKLDIKFVNPKSTVGLLTKDEMKKARDLHDKNKEQLKIPRRPPWNVNMTREELDQNEKESFLEWRRSLVKLQEDEGILLTPYEKNLEFWRQLWRVVERSDVIVQIVDARNPSLFYCEDLEKYVKEVSPDKLNMILVNKADFLTEEQRQHWANYFSSVNLHAVFYSATLATESSIKETINEEDGSEQGSETEEDVLKQLKESVKELENDVEKTAQRLNEITKMFNPQCEGEFQNSKDIVTRDQLIDLFQKIHKGPKVTENITTIGLVGYPNVGKSSTINSLLSAKKVSVSATPGKTKHFQTLFLNKNLLLCDCPGLVMPSFVFTKAEMIINGILPIDQMRDHVPPVNLITNLIPKHILEDKYGIMLPQPMEDNRGFMTANGQPDNPRAARYILKDYMNGKLLYCHSPPNANQEDYHRWPERQKMRSLEQNVPPRQMRAVKLSRTTTEDLDKMFFHGVKSGVHIKGKPILIPNGSGNLESLGDKPWKKINRHENKNKKEKLRRVYAHLDQH
ncbi:large subunit GTPase 1 -like [Asbolus verrucosus]|uniref:Large subunit GTPase 1 homolog n=1 Tax=Asbolus verrucosus TaxID=1661398 RepID=A0A482V6Q6_ASBVE|nr:large subunit GTPase 1 -like [Asbolus verrucosus]